jgi:[ribosomal protein S5]-alanine N-acetyltransferase
MQIITPTCILREWQDKDAKSLTEAANNINIFNNVRDLFPSPYTLKDAQFWIRLCQNTKGPVTSFAIDVGGVAVGNISIMLKEDIYRSNVEIGYFLDERYWGHGIMTEAIKAITQYAFQSFPINRAYAEPFENNHGSRKALEKAGYACEAVFSKNIIKNGKLINSCIYSILKSDFD